MKRLLITEKPSVGKDIAPHLGKVTVGQGYLEVNGGEIIVTWCRGHITELCDADVYLPDSVPTTKAGKKIWRKQDLPILPKVFKVRVTEAKQFKIIKDFLAQAKSANAEIWHGGDPDREGQLLVDRVLELCGVDPDGDRVRRILPSALDDASIKKLLANVRYNREFANLRAAAKARAGADWLVGINGTRAVSIENGTLIAVGRVMTPTAALVIRRDREIANFVPKKYYVPYVVMPDGTKLTWRSRKDIHPDIDEAGRILSKALAEQILAQAKAGPWRVEDAHQKEVKSAPPLPHNLSSLQQQLMQTHKITAAKTLEAAQSLYQNHKLTSYPRTDCRYLPDDQYAERMSVLNAVSTVFPKEIRGASVELHSKAFDTSKVTAHHAIVPTGKTPELGRLGAIERAAYEAVSRQYVAQFYPDAIHRKTGLSVEFNAMDMFAVEESVLVSPGWQTVLGGVKQPTAKEDLKPHMEEDMQDEGEMLEEQRRRPSDPESDRDNSPTSGNKR